MGLRIGGPFQVIVRPNEIEVFLSLDEQQPFDVWAREIEFPLPRPMGDPVVVIHDDNADIRLWSGPGEPTLLVQRSRQPNAIFAWRKSRHGRGESEWVEVK